MKVGVTGATGFIGGRLLRRLLSEGHEVKCLVRNQDKAKVVEKVGAEAYVGDLSDPASLEDFPQNCKYIYHVAALVSEWGKKYDFYKNNVQSTRTLLESSEKHGVKRFIFVSSSTVVWTVSFWKMHDLRNIEETYPYPEQYTDLYNESKSMAEKLVLRFHKERDLETVVIRPSNVWGAGDKVILPRIIEAAKKGFLIQMGSGKNVITPCHVDNLVESLILVTEKDNVVGKIYFINDGNKVKYYNFLKYQLSASGINWEPNYLIPYKLGYVIALSMEMFYKFIKSPSPPVLTRFAVAALSGTRTYSIARAEKDFGYKSVIDYTEGMEKLGKWVDSNTDSGAR